MRQEEGDSVLSCWPCTQLQIYVDNLLIMMVQLLHSADSSAAKGLDQKLNQISACKMIRTAVHSTVFEYETLTFKLLSVRISVERELMVYSEWIWRWCVWAGSPFTFLVIDVSSVSCWGDGLCPVPVCRPVCFYITAPHAKLKDIAAKVIGEFCHFCSRLPSKLLLVYSVKPNIHIHLGQISLFYLKHISV